MDYLPKEPVFDPDLYSEQMHSVLSEEAQKARACLSPPRRKFDRLRFLEAMEETFEQIGGVSRLTMWADKNTTEFFKLYAKTIPQAQILDIQGKMAMQIIPPLPPSPLDGDQSDAIPDEGRSSGPLREQVHGLLGGQEFIPGPKTASSGGVQHVPPKASGKETP